MGKFEKANRPGAGKKKNRTLPLVIGIVCAVAVIVLGIAAFLLLSDDGKIVNNLYVAGVDIGGMTKEEAISALEQQVSFDNDLNIELFSLYSDYELYHTDYDPNSEVETDIFGKPVEKETVPTAAPTVAPTDMPTGETPATPDKTLCLLAEDVGLKLDVEAAVEEAFRMGRSGGLFSRVKSNMLTERYDLDISGYLSMNEDYIREVIDTTAAATETALSEHTVKVGETTVADEDGNPVSVSALEITLGVKGCHIDTDALYEQVVAAYMSAQPTVQYTYEETLPEAVDLDALYDKYCTAPVNAVCDEDTYEITDGKNGHGFSMTEAIARMQPAEAGQTVTLPLTDIEPTYTREKLEDQLFCDVLAYYDSPHVYNPVRTHNLELACEAIDGTIVKPDAVFSFNETVGERTEEKGYGAAGVYVGGRTENQLGGGVCQVASTIYYCTLVAELEVVERAEHQFTPSYVPWGMDATVYWGSLDYKFRNNTPYPIRITASVSDGEVHIRLIGTETRDYTVKMDYTITGYDPAEEVTVYITPDMDDYARYQGYADGDVIQTAYDGYNVTTYRYRYDKDDNLLQSEVVNYSSYDRRDREIAHIGPEEETTEEPTTEEPTEPDTAEPTEDPTDAPTDTPTEPESSEEPTEPSESDSTEPDPIEPDSSEPDPASFTDPADTPAEP